MSDAEAKEGWGFPGGGVKQSVKAHYFVDGFSLCRKWGFYRGPLEADSRPSPDDCVSCRRKLVARQAASTT